MTVRIIVAIAENGVIGANNGMPWRLSTDMKRFKALTEGHPIVMGRKTWESFPKRPLPNRRNIVITRNPSYEAEGAELFPSFEAAIKASDDDLWVVGGGEIYAQALPHTDALHDTPSGPAAKRLFERAWQLYGDARYERLAAISVE